MSFRLTAALGAAFLTSAAIAAPALAATAAKPAAPAAAVTTWTVDKTASKLSFKSSAGGEAFEGTFRRWDAQIAFDPKNLAASKVNVSIDMTSAATGDASRDEMLPTPDWFDAKKFARATFTSTSFKDLGGGKYQAAGNLNLHGVVRPVVLPFSLAIAGDVAKANGTLTLNRSQFKVGGGQFATAETVPFNVQVVVAVTAKKAK